MKAKKLIAIALIGVMVFSLVACGSGKSSTQENSEMNTSQQETENVLELSVADPIELLDTVWNSYGEEDKFAVIGGDFSEENMKENAAGKYSIEDAEALDSALGFPADSIDKIDDAASIIHMMNANTFTCGAFHVKDVKDVESIAASLKEHILERQWMCGFPEKLVIISIGDYVVSMFGHGDNVDKFKTNLMQEFPSAQVISEDPIE